MKKAAIIMPVVFAMTVAGAYAQTQFVTPEATKQPEETGISIPAQLPRAGFIRPGYRILPRKGGIGTHGHDGDVPRLDDLDAPVEVVNESLGTLIAVLGALLKAAADHLRKLSRDRRSHLIGGRETPLAVGEKVAHRVLSREGIRAGQKLVGDHAHGEDVALGPGHVALYHFRRHVLRRAADLAEQGQDALRGRDTQVQEQHLDERPPCGVLGEEHVGGLEVAVDDLAPMGGPQGLSDLPDDLDDLVRVQRRVLHRLGEALGRQLFDDGVVLLAPLADLYDLSDVGMFEKGAALRPSVVEVPPELRVPADGSGNQLHQDGSVLLGVLGLVQLAGDPLFDKLQQIVSAGTVWLLLLLVHECLPVLRGPPRLTSDASYCIPARSKKQSPRKGDGVRSKDGHCSRNAATPMRGVAAPGRGTDRANARASMCGE